MENQTKRCSRCREVQSFSEFYADKRTKTGRASWCKSCTSDYAKIIWARDREKNRKKHAAYYLLTKEQYSQAQRRYNEKIKKLVIDWYGGVCVCCGELCLDFLTLDHIKDDGGKQRKAGGSKGLHLHRAIKKLGRENRPNDLQILCMNCQLGKRIGLGFCAHHPEIDLRIPKEVLYGKGKNMIDCNCNVLSETDSSHVTKQTPLDTKRKEIALANSLAEPDQRKLEVQTTAARLKGNAKPLDGIK
jgi:hypothetical protein